MFMYKTKFIQNSEKLLLNFNKQRYFISLIFILVLINLKRYCNHFFFFLVSKICRYTVCYFLYFKNVAGYVIDDDLSLEILNYFLIEKRNF